MKLSELKNGEKGIIVKVSGRGVFRRRLIEMGFIRGKEVEVINNAPLKDPIHYRLMGYDISIRRAEADYIEMMTPADYEKYRDEFPDLPCDQEASFDIMSSCLAEMAHKRGRSITVAFVGNPNAGKTTLFNIASGSHERVGNYGGVTVDAKEGNYEYNGYKFKIIDLPGTYSLSSYSPEERYVRKQLSEADIDVIVNIVDASNLERNLYLTAQLIDMDVPMVMALNMYDELQKSGNTLDIDLLAEMLGIPIVPTIGRTKFGIDDLSERIIAIYEGSEPLSRHIHINYGEPLEEAIDSLIKIMDANTLFGRRLPKRYVAIQLLECDKDMEERIDELPAKEELIRCRNRSVKHVEEILREDCETAFTDARYGFISGALTETLKESKIKDVTPTRVIDMVLTNKYLGFPFFFLFMWIMFEATFRLGEYPMQWIEWLVNKLAVGVSSVMSDGPLRDLLVEGVINGVGGVIVFLPNILILYLFISLMEDSGYMARAAFIMDKVMHKMGLHGKSFIPLVMGFGCNVPAIMATRTIESRNSRMITMLVLPMMSCSARLPVYLLLVGAFFPENSGFILFMIYVIGILLAVVLARVFKRFLFRGEDVPFVMELPPYRTPTVRSVLHHMWNKAYQYLKKMGGIILIASIVIWFLGYFPRTTINSEKFEAQRVEIERSETIDEIAKEEAITQIDRLEAIDHQENSFIGKIGRTVAPIMKPLGFDWKMSVALITGMAAKEVVVSTMGVLYTGDAESDENTLKERLGQEQYADGTEVFSPLVALSFMLFVLIYLPCIAVVAAIVKESHSWKWGGFLIIYTCVLAWMISFAVFQIGSLF